jgi:hypothetical protein
MLPLFSANSVASVVSLLLVALKVQVGAEIAGCGELHFRPESGKRLRAFLPPKKSLDILTVLLY